MDAQNGSGSSFGTKGVAPVPDHGDGNLLQNHDLNNNCAANLNVNDGEQINVEINVANPAAIIDNHLNQQLPDNNVVVQHVDVGQGPDINNVGANVELLAGNVINDGQNDAENVHEEIQADNVDGLHGEAPFLFPDNIRISRLTNGQRITLAYQYDNIPPKVVQEGAVDPDEVVEEDQTTVHTSFPVAHIVRDAFNNYVSYFEKKSSRELAESAQGESSNVTPTGSVPASNKFQIKPGFSVAPIMDQWAFKSHYRDIPQAVEFDGDIASVKNKSDGPLPKSITLKDHEWGNLQKSASYTLRAVSHIDWFRSGAKNAIDIVLQSLNPDLHGDQIKALRDAKQFLRGISYGSTQIAKMGVYQHGGVTSHLRSEFLNQEGNNILLEEKSQMFSFPFGTSLVFNGLLARVAPSVKVRHDELHSNRQLATSIKLVEQMSKGGDKSFSNAKSGFQPKTGNQTHRGGGQGGRGRSIKAPYYGPQKFHNNNRGNYRHPFPGKRGPKSGDSSNNQNSGQQFKGPQAPAKSGQSN